jgi:hypothetical protein
MLIRVHRELSAADYSIRQETSGRVEPSNGMNEEHYDQGLAEAVPKDPAVESQVCF